MDFHCQSEVKICQDVRRLAAAETDRDTSTELWVAGGSTKDAIVAGATNPELGSGANAACS